VLSSFFFPQKFSQGEQLIFILLNIFTYYPSQYLTPYCTHYLLLLPKKREVNTDTADIQVSLKKANFPLWGEVNKYIKSFSTS